MFPALLRGCVEYIVAHAELLGGNCVLFVFVVVCCYWFDDLPLALAECLGIASGGAGVGGGSAACEGGDRAIMF